MKFFPYCVAYNDVYFCVPFFIPLVISFNCENKLTPVDVYRNDFFYRAMFCPPPQFTVYFVEQLIGLFVYFAHRDGYAVVLKGVAYICVQPAFFVSRALTYYY